MARSRFIGLLALASTLAAGIVAADGTVAAEEETLKFRFVTVDIDKAAFNAPNIEGHSVVARHSAGVATFEDGRIAFKDYVISVDNRGREGDFIGYSTYTFSDGDSMTFRFTGGWGADGLSGDYELVSGTGAYEGATGTGHFDAVKNPWDNASLYDGSFTITKQ